MNNVVQMPVSASRELERYDLLQADESMRAKRLADYACHIAGVVLARLTNRELLRWVGNAAALLRGQQEPWRQAGYEHAANVLHAAIASGETGVVFQGLPAARQREIARLLAQSAVTSYQGILTGQTPLAPGHYMRVVRACEEQ